MRSSHSVSWARVTTQTPREAPGSSCDRLWLSPEEEASPVSVPTAVASERIARENAAAAARKKASRKRRSGTWQHRALLLPLFQVFPSAPP